MAHNTVDFFRFTDRYEDVFVEDGRYLYACAEPYNNAYMLACNEYTPMGDQWLRGDTCSADAGYLAGLEPAPPETAASIIKAETIHKLQAMEKCGEIGSAEEYREVLLSGIDGDLDHILKGGI